MLFVTFGYSRPMRPHWDALESFQNENIGRIREEDKWMAITQNSCTESVVQLDSTVAIQNSILVARNEIFWHQSNFIRYIDID